MYGDEDSRYGGDMEDSMEEQQAMMAAQGRHHYGEESIPEGSNYDTIPTHKVCVPITVSESMKSLGSSRNANKFKVPGIVFNPLDTSSVTSDLSKARIAGLKLKAVNNELPFNVVVVLEGVKGNYGQRLAPEQTDGGHPCGIVLYAGENQRVDVDLGYNLVSIDESYIAEYGTMDPKELARSIEDLSNGFSMVPAGHPALKLIRQSAENLDREDLAQIRETMVGKNRFYTVSTFLAHQALDVINTEIIDLMPFTDLRNITAHVKRLGGSGLDDVDGTKLAGAFNVDDELKMVRNVSCELEISYKIYSNDM
jgi:hypothetical protein